MHLPVVLTPEEVRLVIDRMNGVARLVAQLLYGSGLRLLEALTLPTRESRLTRYKSTAQSLLTSPSPTIHRVESAAWLCLRVGKSIGRTLLR
jgi:hypothetical protein